MLEICDVFTSLAGEGPYVGTPCHFIRFSRCNLRCSFCIGVKPGRRKPSIITTNCPNKKINQVEVGDKLLAMDNSGKLVETEVKEIFQRTVNEHYGIKVEGKRWLYFTPDHPILTNGGWVHAKDLKTNDEVIFITPNEKIRFHKKRYNPMFNPESVKKMIAHNDYKKIGEKSALTIKRLYEEGKLENPLYSLKVGNPEKYEEICRMFSERMKTNNPMKNPETAKKVAEKMKVLMKGRKFSGEHRRKIALSKMGDKNPMRRPEVAAKSWIGHHRRPSSIENFVIDVVRSCNFPVTYVGNGKMWVGSKEDKLYNPDFVVDGQKKVIEVYDPTYLRRGEVWRDNRISHFEKYGYECLALEITWKTPEDDVSRALRNFISNGLKVQSIKKYFPKRYKCLGPKPLKVYNFRCEPYNNFFVDYILSHNCDTKYAWSRGNKFSIEKLISMVLELGDGAKMVVLTGGEPLLQDRKSLARLCGVLKSKGFKILVETNGTLTPTPTLLKKVDIWSISPKLKNSGHRIRYGGLKWLKNAKEWYFKFVIRVPKREIPNVTEYLKKRDLPSSIVFLQPVNEPGVDYVKKSRELAKFVLENNLPYKVIPQFHVLLGLK